jgi:hypothetical protein
VLIRLRGHQALSLVIHLQLYWVKGDLNRYITSVNRAQGTPGPGPCHSSPALLGQRGPKQITGTLLVLIWLRGHQALSLVVHLQLYWVKKDLNR